VPEKLEILEKSGKSWHIFPIFPLKKLDFIPNILYIMNNQKIQRKGE